MSFNHLRSSSYRAQYHTHITLMRRIGSLPSALVSVRSSCGRRWLSNHQTHNELEGTVVRWVHERGYGHVKMDTAVPETALVDRGALGGGFFLTEGQRIRGTLKTRGSGSASNRLKHVVNINGAPIRPRVLRGIVTKWSDVMLDGTVTELDLAGNLIAGAPQFTLAAADYACAVPAIQRDMKVLFCVEGNCAKRVVFNYTPKSPISATGRVREIREKHGFITEDVSRESIYFPLVALVHPVQVGDMVSFRVAEEPPVSLSAGKKVAFSICLRR